MIEEILLLSDPALIEDLDAVLVRANPRLVVTHILTRQDMDACENRPLTKTRLLSFGSEIIVPQSVLSRLGGGAYNFHPGPPTHPGRFPSSFFIHDGGTMFGSTVHEMAAKVDSGPIHAVDWFEVPAGVDCVTLNAMSYFSLMAMFERLAPHLSQHQDPLSHSDDVWSGHTTTQDDFDDLCRLPENVSEEEFQRRYRAVGEGPDHALEFSLHGHRFILDNQHAAPDVKIGGKKR